MKNNLRVRPSSAAVRRELAATQPQFVRPAANRGAARARFATSSLDDLWTPRLLERLHAPLTRLRD